jgi:membrane protein YdbS with pleckstrin-like domain
MSVDVPIIKDSFWRYITNFWCLVSYTAIIIDFVYDNALSEILSSILVIYVALLVIFAGVKEFERWYEFRKDRHPGEIFVIGWTVLVMGILVAKVALHKEYHIPEEILSTYIAVLSIMAITQKSKRLKVERDIHQHELDLKHHNL